MLTDGEGYPIVCGPSKTSARAKVLPLGASRRQAFRRRASGLHRYRSSDHNPSPRNVNAHTLLTWATTGSAIAAALVLFWFLLARPALTGSTKVYLLFGIGVFPVGAALTGSIASYEATKTRDFCGSCHVMQPWVQDAEDPSSRSLAARHTRNAWFGKDNCYTCHADYSLLGPVITKIGGMKHASEYYTHYKSVPAEQAAREIKIYEPYRNEQCMRCHSTRLPGWSKTPDHAASLHELRTGKISCVSGGCHGPAHPVGVSPGKAALIERGGPNPTSPGPNHSEIGADATSH